MLVGACRVATQQNLPAALVRHFGPTRQDARIPPITLGEMAGGGTVVWPASGRYSHDGLIQIKFFFK